MNRLTSQGAPNGVTTNHAYDGIDRLTSLTHVKGAMTVIGNQYGYNDANNIASWANANGDHAYDYDPVDRLTAASNSAQPNENYSYDEVGNRIKSDFNGGYSYEPVNRLVNTGDANYSYDNNGNLISKVDSQGETDFTWNEENQLTEVDLPNGEVVSYKYDTLGRRIQRTTRSGANERYVYDGADVLLDLNANSSVATTYLNGPGIDNHLRQTSATTGISYFLTDHLGSSAGLTDGSGSLVEETSYDSFGNSTGSTRTRYGYTGRERDPDNGLMYYRARWYDPQVGRLISEDPIGLEGGTNWYAYVTNDPLRFKDPLGLKIWVCSRLTKFPLSLVGANHSYFYDDRNGGSCGLSGAPNPFDPYPYFGSTHKERGPNEGATCRPVDGSDDPFKADAIMNCCKGYKGSDYTPGFSDCHNLTHSCITGIGLKDPGAPGGRSENGASSVRRHPLPLSRVLT